MVTICNKSDMTKASSVYECQGTITEITRVVGSDFATFLNGVAYVTDEAGNQFQVQVADTPYMRICCQNTFPWAL